MEGFCSGFSEDNPALMSELRALRNRKHELESHLTSLQDSRRQLMDQLEGLMKLLKVNNLNNVLSIYILIILVSYKNILIIYTLKFNFYIVWNLGFFFVSVYTIYKRKSDSIFNFKRVFDKKLDLVLVL